MAMTPSLQALLSGAVTFKHFQHRHTKKCILLCEPAHTGHTVINV